MEGYEENGEKVEPYTRFGGAYARHTGADPFMLPPSWMAKQAAVDATVPLNFVTTNDIIGGNSGSPVVNTRGEVIGLIFDGNIQSLGGNFAYDDSRGRAVCVDSRALVEAMRSIYGAGKVADELMGK